ncbi:VIT and VWA domain-containing protein [Massilia sp. H6]|uniref:VIT and vWA domain-containing protein n=1 Tax=Massilia sp. H6 TaxID=2970464 RepID=UPI002167AB3D|nr:VIT and VWA domain-containing protein [Massilia sp. H6]UVW30666.1 VIT and VWA domain-containing protein [Massilia sp. H6]
MSIVQLRDASMPRHGRLHSSVLRSVRADGSVRGLLFELAIEQCYVNASEVSVEAVYTFPIPWDAVLLGVEFVLGERVLEGVVAAKAEAERRYEGALEAGDSALMVERAADGIHTVNVGNLLPGEQGIVRFRYARLLSFAQGHVRLVVPTVIGPRYGDARSAGLQPHQEPLTDLLAEHPFSLRIRLYGDIAGAELSSPSHGMSVQSAEESVVISLHDGARLDRDFVLLADGLAGRSVSTFGRDGDGYVALASFCPVHDDSSAETPLNVKILIDCSGSMNGDRIAAARQAVHEVLSRLEPEDSFSFSCFGSEVRHFSGSLLATTPRAVKRASEWSAATQADMGGTEIKRALLSTFALGQPYDADILLITDGDVWEADALIASAEQAGQRVFAVGIGSAPASSLLHSLARRTGGACELAAADCEVQGAVLRMFRRMRRAPVRDVKVAWTGAPVWQCKPARVVFRGETIHQFAGFAEYPTGAKLSWCEHAGDAREMSVPINAIPVEGDTLARVAAAARMDELAPSERHALALRYELVDATTNLVLVHRREGADKALVMPTLRTVAQMLPAGWGGLGIQVSSQSARQPAVWRREESSPPLMLARDSVDHYEVPAFLRAKPALGSRYLYRDTLRRFAETVGVDLVRAGAAGLSTTSLDALSADLPTQVVEELRQVVTDGFPESDVIQSFVAVLVKRMRSDAIARRMFKTILRMTARTGDSSEPDLEQRVLAIALRAYDARSADPKPHDIPAFLRRRAD